MKTNLIIVAIIIFLGILLRLVLLVLYDFTYDDAFIVFRVSQNIAKGKGFVYNDGERVLGITSPLYALLLAFFFKFFDDILVISKILGLVFYVLSCVMLVMLTKKLFRNHYPALFSVLLFSFDFYSVSIGISGLETMIFTFFLLLSFYLYFCERKNKIIWKTPILVGISFLLRPEAAFLMFPILLDQFLISKKKLFLKVFLIGILSFLTVLPWLLFSFYYFGSFLPTSFFTKSTENILLGSTDIRYLFFHVGIFFLEIPLALFFAISVLLSFKKNFDNFIMFSYVVIVIILYILLNMSRYRWYYVPHFLIVFVYSGAGIYNFIKNLSLKSYLRTNVLTCFIIILILGTQVVRYFEKMAGVDVSFVKQLKEIALEIFNKTKGNATVAVRDVGIVGFYSRAKILDYSGLVSPEVIPYLLNGTIDKYILSRKPDYIFIPKYVFERLEGMKTIKNNPEFIKNYELLKRYEYSHGNYLEVYKLVDI